MKKCEDPLVDAQSLEVQEPFSAVILALGAESKNTLCLGYDHTLLLSSTLGDLAQFETFQSFQYWTEEFPRRYHQTPEVFVVDQHPGYHSTQWGKTQATKLHVPVIEVQHHHAHAASAMFDHHLSQSFCLVFDGNGAGSDQTLWGGELFWVDRHRFEHLATFAPASLPGGERAILEPYRQVFARFPKRYRENSFLQQLKISPQEANLFHQMIDRKINTFQTRAVGRLFDSVSALLGIAPKKIEFEAQPAILLESLAQSYIPPTPPKAYPYTILSETERLEVDTTPLFEKLWEELTANVPSAQIAWQFHYTVADIAVHLIQKKASLYPAKTVTLSGGVFQNQLLTHLLDQLLTQQGFQVFRPRKIPAHDAGIALGQILIAQQLLKQNIYA